MESDYTEKKKKKQFPVITCGPGPAGIPQGSWMKQRSKLPGLNYALNLQSHLKFYKTHKSTKPEYDKKPLLMLKKLIIKLLPLI